MTLSCHCSRAPRRRCHQNHQDQRASQRKESQSTNCQNIIRLSSKYSTWYLFFRKNLSEGEVTTPRGSPNLHCQPLTKTPRYENSCCSWPCRYSDTNFQEVFSVSVVFSFDSSAPSAAADDGGLTYRSSRSRADCFADYFVGCGLTFAQEG